MALLLVLLVLFGFGVAASAPTSDEPRPRRPPTIELVSEAGVQQAVQGSYCINGPDSGECVEFEAPAGPEQLSVVRPGEVVTIVVTPASAVEGTASVRRRGCDEELTSVVLHPETRWTVDLEPGAYELQIFTTFELGSTSGDTSGGLGLLVDADAPLEVRRAGPLVACPAG
jgi:hypothetical protein